MANDITFLEGFPSGSSYPGIDEYIYSNWGPRWEIPRSKLTSAYVDQTTGELNDLSTYGVPCANFENGDYAVGVPGAFSTIITYEDVEMFTDNTGVILYNIPIGNNFLRETLTITRHTATRYTSTVYCDLTIDLIDGTNDTVMFNYQTVNDIALVKQGSLEGYLHNRIMIGAQYATTVHATPIEYDPIRDALLSMFVLVYGFQIAGDDPTFPYPPTAYSLRVVGIEDDKRAVRYFDRSEIGWKTMSGQTETMSVSDKSVMIDLAVIYDITGQEIETKEMSPEAGVPSDEDGMRDPSFDNSSDTIGLPDAPTTGVSNVGFVNVYKTSSNSLQNMGVELFPPLAYTPPAAITAQDTTDAIINGFNSIVTFLANIPSFFEQSVASTLINYIIDCHVIPVTPSGGSSEYIKVGYKTLTSSGYRLSNDYVDFDCGSINIAEYYQSFIDHSGTSAKLFLPFVGFVPARTEWFYRDTLNVTYRFNIVDGSFMAFVRSTGRYVNNNNAGPTIVGQYSGNACIHLPITGVTYSNMVSGLVGAGAGAVASAGSGSVAGVATSALNAATLRGDIPQSNAYSSSGSFLSVRRPFLMIERPVSNYSKTYQKEIGIPSNISMKLSKMSGFATVSDIHLDGITATDQEKNELERLLSQGVIF